MNYLPFKAKSNMEFILDIPGGKSYDNEAIPGKHFLANGNRALGFLEIPSNSTISSLLRK